MSHRQDNSPNISFFSFQDIITSVTGIMFLVVLMLILSILEQQNGTPEEKKEKEQLTELSQELKRLQSELEQSLQSSIALEKRLQELEKLSIQEIPARIQKLGTELALLEEANKRSEEHNLDAKNTIQSLTEKMAKQEGILRAGGKEKEGKAKEQKLLTTQARELKEKMQAAQKTIRFTWKRQVQKQPILVECSKDVIRMGVSQNVTPMKVFTTTKGKSAHKEFLSWIRQYDTSKYYFLLLAKPEAFPYIENLSYELKSSGYERGREILPDNDVEIFQVQGGKP